MVPKSFLKTGVVEHRHLDGRLSRLCPCGQSLLTVAATKVGFVLPDVTYVAAGSTPLGLRLRSEEIRELQSAGRYPYAGCCAKALVIMS